MAKFRLHNLVSLLQAEQQIHDDDEPSAGGQGGAPVLAFKQIRSGVQCYDRDFCDFLTIYGNNRRFF
jgi:hypothetical protein